MAEVRRNKYYTIEVLDPITIKRYGRIRVTDILSFERAINLDPNIININKIVFENAGLATQHNTYREDDYAVLSDGSVYNTRWMSSATELASKRNVSISIPSVEDSDILLIRELLKGYSFTVVDV